MDIFDLSAKITLDSSEYEKGVDNAKGKMSGLGSALGNIAKGVAAGVGAAATGVAALAKSAVSAYADYEQLVGGVETLFKDSAGAVQGYAENAYKTAGLSANEYMETVTSFSASLLQSLDGDTAAAAAAADLAITDMADNANKMGTAMESIQNAYQGFAKQNYTMLDNLKLGYGGTKEEMQRLLDDAEKLTGKQFDLSSYGDIVEAIHAIQVEMDIAGTTSKEAASTISGSASSMKSAWKNLVAGLGNKDADLSALFKNVLDSAKTFATNLIPVVVQSLSGISEAIAEIAPALADTIPNLINGVLPSLLSAANGLMTSFLASLPSILQILVDQVPAFVDGLIQMIDIVPQMVKVGQQALLSLVQGLSGSIDKVMPAITQTIVALVDILTDPDVLINMIEAGMEILEALVLGILDALPQILEVSWQVTERFASALVERFPELVAKGADMLKHVYDGIVTALTLMLEAAAQMLAKIGEGIANGVSKLKEKGRDMVNAIRDGIMEKINAAKEWGADLISNFIGGIKEKWENLKETVSNVANTVKDFLGFSEPKKGPLSNFHTYAPDMMDLFAKGIRENEHVVTDQIEKSFNFGTRTIDFAASASGISSAGMINAVGSTNRDSNVTLYANLVTPDGKNLATFMLSDLIEVARENGTPIANPA